jgi:hypothetical protein
MPKIAIVLMGILSLLEHTQAAPEFVRDGVAGFVVSDFKYALADDAARSGACPRGLSLDMEEIFARTPSGKRRKGESDEAYAGRLRAGSIALSTAPDGQNVCLNPEAAQPDPYFRTVTSPSVPADGIDIDGIDSRVGAPSAPGTCAHQDQPGMHGERGIDNQFSRIVGCLRSFQSSGQSNGFALEMLTGSWGILLEIRGLDDLRNDDAVEVGIFANADPIQLSPNRVPLAYATYAMDQDRRFRARTRGRMKDGVLTTDPVDVRFHSVTNSLRFERPLLRARLQATISEEGSLSGYLAGYTPVEAMYDFQFGYRSGKDGKGELGPLRLRLGTGNGAARVNGYTCPGVYFALYEHADGDPEPGTGRCTSISTQYRVTAIPAFVVDVATRGSNDATQRE